MVQVIGNSERAAPSIVIYLPDLSGGGAERLHVQLVGKLRQAGLAPRFLLDRKVGELLNTVPADCPIDVLRAGRQLSALPRLVRYLRETRPAVLIANMEHMNVMAVAARAIARAPTRIIVTQHNSFSEQAKRASWQFKALPALYRAALPFADAVVAVSRGVADDLSVRIGRARNTIDVIHNGVVSDDFDLRAGDEPDHPWFTQAPPIILAMGRLVAQKDFETLLRAFATVAIRSDARLIILGEGPLRDDLQALTSTLGLSDRVAFPGFLANPLPWLRRAKLFVLSSKFEGFGNVLAEALACGTPVVSTDCPYGPSEILEGGRYGALVPVGNATALADGIAGALSAAPDHASLRARGRHFSVASCATAYCDLIWQLLMAPAAGAIGRNTP